MLGAVVVEPIVIVVLKVSGTIDVLPSVLDVVELEVVVLCRMVADESSAREVVVEIV